MKREFVVSKEDASGMGLEPGMCFEYEDWHGVITAVKPFDEGSVLIVALEQDNAVGRRRPKT